jgi:hypothetical protein
VLKKPATKPITDRDAFKDRTWRTRTDEIMAVLHDDSARHRSAADE